MLSIKKKERIIFFDEVRRNFEIYAKLSKNTADLNESRNTHYLCGLLFVNVMVVVINDIFIFFFMMINENKRERERES